EVRQSTRKFGAKMPGDEAIAKILDAGRRAPTAKNVQPVTLYVLKSEKALAAVDNASPCRYGAPLVVMVGVDTNEACCLDGHSTAEIDGSIAATHLMLAATDRGVDSIWIERFDRKILKDGLGIADNVFPVCLLPLGYRADDCPVSRNFHNRKPLSDVVKYL
ncbi:MAG: nitroreductase family protein, partial [Clostridia bacterium]|nr:nitroreductase family protein [Clostridia bacterium]